jgi:hypothetical protein
MGRCAAVPDRGAAAAITFFRGGQVQVNFDNMPSIVAHIRSSASRAPGDKSAERLRQMDALKSTPKQVEGKLTAEINLGRDGTAPGLFRQRVVIQTAKAFGDNIKAETETQNERVRPLRLLHQEPARRLSGNAAAVRLRRNIERGWFTLLTRSRLRLC